MRCGRSANGHGSGNVDNCAHEVRAHALEVGHAARVGARRATVFDHLRNILSNRGEILDDHVDAASALRVADVEAVLDQLLHSLRQIGNFGRDGFDGRVTSLLVVGHPAHARRVVDGRARDNGLRGREMRKKRRKREKMQDSRC